MNTDIDAPSGFVLDQLTGDVLAELSRGRWHLAVVFPVAAGRVSKESGRRGMRHSCVRHQPCSFP